MQTQNMACQRGPASCACDESAHCAYIGHIVSIDKQRCRAHYEAQARECLLQSNEPSSNYDGEAKP